jgi:hypothetical protein
MSEEFNRGYALLIGVSTYQLLNSLCKPHIDAQDLHNVLTELCGYNSSQVILLQNDEASKTNIDDKFDWLARRVTADDTVIIFFSGHGAQRIGGFEAGEYLCPVETDWYNLRNTAISNEEMSEALRAINARKVVVFLDACHSGGVGKPKDASLKVKAGFSQETYTELAKGEGRVIIASCKPNEVSWELKSMRNGLFSHYLLDGLRGAAAENDSMVSILDLFQYVYLNVVEHTNKIGVQQTPLLKAETGDFPVAVVRQSTLAAEDPGLSQPEKEGRKMEVPDRATLFACLKKSFLLQDLKQVCFLLGVRWVNLSGQVTDEKVISLIEYAEARQKVDELWTSMQHVVPEIDC